jgi:protoporphyrinogen oxidase
VAASLSTILTLSGLSLLLLIFFYRVGFTHNFAPRSVPSGNSSLYIEIAGSPDEKINSEELFGRAISDLKRAGILGEYDEIVAMQYLPIPYAYVVTVLQIFWPDRYL